MKISIKDIAKQLNISATVVSLVLNNKEKESRISLVTAQKIRELAAELNYTPNRFATGLKNGKSKILGLIVADISNPFFAKLARHIEDEAEKLGYKIIIGSSDESPKKMASIIEVMITYQIDGFLIVPPENSQDQIRELIANNYSLVLIDRYFSQVQVDSVLVNNEDAAFKATNYLINQGCKHIALFNFNMELEHFLDRTNGYKNALISNGLTIYKDAIQYAQFDSLDNDVRQGMKQILDSPTIYDGIFFSSDTLALSAIQTLRTFHINIPQRFKIFSFDQNKTFDFLDFPVPRFAQPLSEMGRKAVHLIVNQIQERNTIQPQRILLESDLEEK